MKNVALKTVENNEAFSCEHGLSLPMFIPCLQFLNLCLPYSMYISLEFNFVLFVLILFGRIYSERKFNIGVTASMCHVV